MWILLAGWILFILCSYPGYLSFDSVQQFTEVRTGKFTDWHPAVMTQLWSWLEYVIAGPITMLVLQSGLFLFGLSAILRRTVVPQAAALIAVGVLLFPPVFSPMAVIWPESLMAGALFAATGALMDKRRGWKLAGAALLLVALSCRPEAVLAVIPLALLERPAKRGVATALGLVVVVAIGARLADRVLIDQRVFAYQRKLELVDVVGTLRRARADAAAVHGAFLHLAAPDRDGLPARIASAPDAFDPYPLEAGDKRIIDPVATEDQASAMDSAWRDAFASKPYLLHRWALMRRVLGLASPWYPVYDEFGNTSQIYVLHHRATPSDIEIGMSAFVHGCDFLFKPWLFGLFALIGLPLAWRRRELRALLASGLVLEISLFIFAPVAEYRASHWLVATTSIALATLAVRRRVRWRA